MSYTVNCPFCENEIEMMRSEFKFSSINCTTCGCRVKCDNFNNRLCAIMELPRTEYRVKLRGKKHVTADDITSAKEKIIDAVQEDVDEELDITVQDCVSPDTVRQVLENASDSSTQISIHPNIETQELIDYNVDVSKL